MKRLLIFLPISFLFVSLLTSAPSLSTTRGIRVTAKEGKSLYLYNDYYALVVGISDYEKWPNLPNAVNDAKEIASKLKELGFEVSLVLDPTYQEMKAVLNDMVYEIGKEENRAILFYYAGHGETEALADGTKMGYIIPKDCPVLKKDPKGFASHAISMRDIESVSLRTRSKHLLMLFDSCFSGSLFNMVRAVPDDITEKSALPVRQYITAGRQDEQVPDRSVFKRSFLIGLDGEADLTGDGYITGSELGMYLSEKVVNYTRGQQHPQYGKINNPNLDRGDFIFASMKAREKEEAAEKKVQEERAAVAEELKKLREEMKKSEGIVEQMKRLLEARVVEEKVRKEDAERKALEEEVKRLRTEMDKSSLTIKELQSRQAEQNVTAGKGDAEKEALEKELNRLKTEMDRASLTIKELQSRQAAEKAAAGKEDAEKKALEKELNRLKAEMDKSSLTIKELQSRQTEQKVTAGKEDSEKKALEEELNRMKAEMDKASLTIKELQSKQAAETRLAYIPDYPKRILNELRNGQGPFVIDDFESKDLCGQGILMTSGKRILLLQDRRA
jgi:uncharacterized caspase-like protein